MNGTHLPAGQPMPGGSIVGGAPGPGPSGGRRRPPPQYSSQQPYHHQHVNPMYQSSYMNPYANTYYPQMPHHYQPTPMPTSPYGVPYNPYAQRSPPIMHQQYPPIVSSSMQPHPQPYTRPPPPQQQPSPAISTPPPFSAPAPPAPVPQTPSSTHSSQAALAPLTPPTPQTQATATSVPDVEVLPVKKTPFRAPLPWYSPSAVPFPSRGPRSRRRRRLDAASSSVELPANPQAGAGSTEETNEVKSPDTSTGAVAAVADESVAPAAPSEKLLAHDIPSDDMRPASPSTPVSAKSNHTSAATAASVTPTNSSKPSSRTAVPAVPIVPILPKTSPTDNKSTAATEGKTSEGEQTTTRESMSKTDETVAPPVEVASAAPKPESTQAPVKAAPKLWTGLFARPAPTVAPSTNANTTQAVPTAAATTSTPTDGTIVGNGNSVVGPFSKSNTSSLAEALRTYRVSGGEKIAFLEPRGLINPGNMCYMNSVLQVLIFCIPFYDFLDQVGKKAAHSFKSETPLIDAMIMFMREYKVIDSAVSVEQLRRRLKSEELEQYGEPFTPEFVYEAIKTLPRFASMRRGHQQDAEEFLGFLLEGLHDECAHVMRHAAESSSSTTAASSSAATPTATSSPTSTADSNDWLEVGRKQRAAVTRSSGHPVASSPITKIFGGQLRSELRVTGLKDSVTLEPFQPLQLDIGSPQVHNILDAMKGLTRPETLHGDFGSPRGRDAVATKQVFIESLPPVLILHLKRFQFDAEGTGTIKIWKKIGYPLELELPKEVFSRQRRNTFNAEGAGFPKYKLIAAVYHHGKNASGGHYTVDLRRQDGREWIRMDDTVIRRIRSEDVAEGGAEEDTNKAAAWADKKDSVVGASGNRFEGIGDQDAGDDEGWNKVSGSVNGAKKWSSVVNGGAPKDANAQARGKAIKDNIKDNKVAYLLFYQRV
ncbi:cysteine proteinase [Xylariomycetidae sp. FL0641]|nr:cysteine proteinase [Xylariomycetidae sp. FL0641]